MLFILSHGVWSFRAADGGEPTMMDFRGRLMPRQQLDIPTTVISPAVSPAPRDAWEVVLRSDPLALESQSPAWTDAACAAGPFEDASRLYETHAGRSRHLLPRACRAPGPDPTPLAQPAHRGVVGNRRSRAGQGQGARRPSHQPRRRFR